MLFSAHPRTQNQVRPQRLNIHNYVHNQLLYVLKIPGEKLSTKFSDISRGFSFFFLIVPCANGKFRKFKQKCLVEWKELMEAQQHIPQLIFFLVSRMRVLSELYEHPRLSHSALSEHSLFHQFALYYLLLMNKIDLTKKKIGKRANDFELAATVTMSISFHCMEQPQTSQTWPDQASFLPNVRITVSSSWISYIAIHRQRID